MAELTNVQPPIDLDDASGDGPPDDASEESHVRRLDMDEDREEVPPAKQNLIKWAPAARLVFQERLAEYPLLRWRRSPAGPLPPLFGLGAQHEAIYTRLRRAAVEGESTSLVLVGNEGTGRHATLMRVLERLDAEEGVPRFDVTNLSGIIHADPATGLRELAAQLSSTGQARTRYVDDLTLLVDELRRRRAERRAPLLVVLDELDGFALQPRQTLLYTLLDAMQSRLGCVVVVGVTCDHGVLELFEKRVRSRLQNHQVGFWRPVIRDIEEFLLHTFKLDAAQLRAAGLRCRCPIKPDDAPDDGVDAYVDAHARSWCDVWENGSKDSALAKFLVEGHRSGQSMRFFARVAARAVLGVGVDEPVLGKSHFAMAFHDQMLNSAPNWRESVRAMPPAEKALLVAYLKLERVGAPYCLESAAHILSRLGQASADDAFTDERLLEAQYRLVDTSIAVLSSDAKGKKGTHVLRYSHVRLAQSVDVEDLWLALREDDLNCPTSLRQWALNHV